MELVKAANSSSSGYCERDERGADESGASLDRRSNSQRECAPAAESPGPPTEPAYGRSAASSSSSSDKGKGHGNDKSAAR